MRILVALLAFPTMGLAKTYICDEFSAAAVVPLKHYVLSEGFDCSRCRDKKNPVEIPSEKIIWDQTFNEKAPAPYGSSNVNRVPVEIAPKQFAVIETQFVSVPMQKLGFEINCSKEKTPSCVGEIFGMDKVRSTDRTFESEKQIMDSRFPEAKYSANFRFLHGRSDNVLRLITRVQKSQGQQLGFKSPTSVQLSGSHEMIFDSEPDSIVFDIAVDEQFFNSSSKTTRLEGIEVKVTCNSRPDRIDLESSLSL